MTLFQGGSEELLKLIDGIVSLETEGVLPAPIISGIATSSRSFLISELSGN